jgi:hypothetical protein
MFHKVEQQFERSQMGVSVGSICNYRKSGKALHGILQISVKGT